MSAATPAPRTSRVTAVRTPGEAAPAANPAPQPDPATPVTADGETDADALAAAADDLDDGAGDDAGGQPGGGEPTITLTQAQLDAAIQRAVNGAVAHTLASQRAASQPMRDAELPDQRDIDRTKIERPVLSKQGYVVPEGYGEPKSPAAKQMRL